MGGCVPLGYDVCDRRLVINEEEAETVRAIFQLYLELGCVRLLKETWTAARSFPSREFLVVASRRVGTPSPEGHYVRSSRIRFI